MKFLNAISPYAHWLLRLALASVFLYHGLGKFPAAAGMAQMMKMPIAAVYLLATVETAGALLVLYGGLGADWATRIGGLLITPVMLGAIFLVHWGQWSFQPTESHPQGGIEFQVTLLSIALYFLLRGNGSQPESQKVNP